MRRAAALELRTSPSPTSTKPRRRRSRSAARCSRRRSTSWTPGGWPSLQDPTGAVFQVWQANTQHRREDSERAGRALLDRADDERHEGRGEVLHRTVRLDAEAQRAGRADGVHRVQRRRPAEHRHDGEAGAHAGAHPVVLDAVLPGRRTATRASRKRRSSAATSWSAPQDIPNTGRFAIVSDPQGAMFAVFRVHAEISHVHLFEKAADHSVEGRRAARARRARCRCPTRTSSTSNRITPPFPDGLERAVFGMGCFWGAEKKFWQLPRRLQHRRRLRRRADAEPDLSRGLHRHDRPQRGRARRVRSEDRQLRRSAEGVLGEPRSDAGHAAGQRRRHAVPLRHLLRERRAAARRGSARATRFSSS